MTVATLLLTHPRPRPGAAVRRGAPPAGDDGSDADPAIAMAVPPFPPPRCPRRQGEAPPFGDLRSAARRRRSRHAACGTTAVNPFQDLVLVDS